MRVSHLLRVSGYRRCAKPSTTSNAAKHSDTAPCRDRCDHRLDPPDRSRRSGHGFRVACLHLLRLACYRHPKHLCWWSASRTCREDNTHGARADCRLID